jgi:hypothetical protein
LLKFPGGSLTCYRDACALTQVGRDLSSLGNNHREVTIAADTCGIVYSEDWEKLDFMPDTARQAIVNLLDGHERERGSGMLVE